LTASPISKRLTSDGATAVGRDTFLLHLGDSLRALGSDTEAVTAEACRLLGEHLSVAQVGFAKVLPDGERVVVDRDWNDGRIPSVVGTWRMDDFGPAFIADLRRGKTAAIPDITRDPRTSAPEVAAAYAAIRIRAILNVPLHRAGRMVALLFTHHPEPRPWSPAEISLVEETVERVWLAVLRARAEAELHHSEEIRRLALDAAGIGTFVWDVSADIAEADTRARHLLSFGPDEPVTWATALGCLIHPDDRDQLAAALRRATDPTGDGYLANDVRILLPEERARWVAIAGRTVFEGTPPRAMRMVGTVLDITERKQAEERLRESEARLRTLSDAVPAMVWSYDNDGNNLSMNARWFEFTGQKPEEVRGAGWTACTHPEDLVGILPLWERCRREGGVYEGEVRYRRADGMWRWHAFRGLPLRTPRGGSRLGMAAASTSTTCVRLSGACGTARRGCVWRPKVRASVPGRTIWSKGRASGRQRASRYSAWTGHLSTAAVGLRRSIPMTAPGCSRRGSAPWTRT
jgi:PAS domain S-box-containing protein